MSDEPLQRRDDEYERRSNEWLLVHCLRRAKAGHSFIRGQSYGGAVAQAVEAQMIADPVEAPSILGDPTLLYRITQSGADFLARYEAGLNEKDRARDERRALAISLADSGFTYAQIGREFGVSVERARQIVVKARRVLAEAG